MTTEKTTETTKKISPSPWTHTMTEAEIAAEIIQLVPSWYQAKCGPHRHLLTIGDHEEPFYYHRTLSFKSSGDGKECDAVLQF